MTIDTGPATRPGISTAAALLSIAGFWAFYFAIVTLRAIVLRFDDQLDMLIGRAIVTAASMAITVLIWLVLRRLRDATLARRVAVAGLLAIPAAIAYSTISYRVFMVSAKHTQVMISSTTRDDDGKMVTVQVGGAHDEALDPTMAIADNAANGYFFFAAWAALFLALSFAAETGAAERRAARFQSAAQAAELRALRYQVNPHFLFNTLNSLSSLIMTDRRDAAEAMVMNLSTFFRTSLTGDPTEDVPLSDELRLQALYLEIEGVRFPTRMRVDVDVPPDLLDACVPGLILQPLVENAIKHGVARTRRPVGIAVSARASAGRLVLAVEDDGDEPMAEPGAGSGIGLRNVRERLAARFGNDADAQWGPRPGGGWLVTLTMPLVRNGCR